MEEMIVAFCTPGSSLQAAAVKFSFEFVLETWRPSSDSRLQDPTRETLLGGGCCQCLRQRHRWRSGTGAGIGGVR